MKKKAQGLPNFGKAKGRTIWYNRDPTIWYMKDPPGGGGSTGCVPETGAALVHFDRQAPRI